MYGLFGPLTVDAADPPPVPDDYLRPYQEAVETYGSNFHVTLWAHPKSQRLRFEAFTTSIDFAHRRVLDIGCSRGDLAEYLTQHEPNYAAYVGIDPLPSVIDFARQRGLPRAEFVAGDAITHPELIAEAKPDIVTVSGTLNTMDFDTAGSLLEPAWHATRQALVFNFLSDRPGPDAVLAQHPAVRLPTFRLLDWALTRTWNVVLRQDYFPDGHDAMIVMRKPDAD